MPDNRIPKQIFFVQLASGKRLQGGPVRRYKDALKLNLKQCGILPESFSSASLNRSAWRSQCHEAIDEFEEAHVAVLEHKLAVRKNSASPCTAAGAWPCDRSTKICQSRILGFMLTSVFTSPLTQSVENDSAIRLSLSLSLSLWSLTSQVDSRPAVPLPPRPDHNHN